MEEAVGESGEPAFASYGAAVFASAKTGRGPGMGGRMGGWSKVVRLAYTWISIWTVSRVTNPRRAGRRRGLDEEVVGWVNRLRQLRRVKSYGASGLFTIDSNAC